MTTAETTMNEGTVPTAVGCRLDRTVRPVPARVYRVQDVEGRGPWRPGFSRALLRAGRSIAARMAMIAITTRSSIRVNARVFRGLAVRIVEGSLH